MAVNTKSLELGVLVSLAILAVCYAGFSQRNETAQFANGDNELPPSSKWMGCAVYTFRRIGGLQLLESPSYICFLS